MDRPNKKEAKDAVKVLLPWIGDDPNREGLLDTPAWVVKAYEDWFSGYSSDPVEYLKKVFYQTAIVVGLFALPGVIFLLYWPKILEATFAFKLQNSLLVNASIMSFYLIPFYSILHFCEKKKYN